MDKTLELSSTGLGETLRNVKCNSGESFKTNKTIKAYIVCCMQYYLSEIFKKHLTDIQRKSDNSIPVRFELAFF